MKIGIIGAMDIEVELLVKKLEAEETTEAADTTEAAAPVKAAVPAEAAAPAKAVTTEKPAASVKAAAPAKPAAELGKETKTKAGMTFHEGRIGGKDVVIVKCGVGKVNAAVCVQLLCDLYGVTHIINTGVAGSLDNRIDVGDVVVSTDAMYHDVDATVFGYRRGEVPQLGVVSFAADEMLREKAAAAIRAAAPDVAVFEGRVVSGDQFVCTRAQKEMIKAEVGGMCTEMEGAAIAQAAYLNEIPFVIVRAISDKADESVQVAYEEFEAKAAADCAALVAEMLQTM